MLLPQKLTNFLSNPTNTKALWTYVAIAFNKVDYERLKIVGADRLCAEWILKNGGAIEFSGAAGRFIRDYNVLPPEGNKVTVKTIDASNSSIMKMGFEHLIGCKKVDKIILNQCKHLEEGCLTGLHHVKESLKVLQVSGCDNLADKDFKVLGDLKHLESLSIFDMKYVNNLDTVIQDLKVLLPNCHVNDQ